MADLLLHDDVTPEEVAEKGEWSDCIADAVWGQSPSASPPHFWSPSAPVTEVLPADSVRPKKKADQNALVLVIEG
jgi:hypothetical protein